MAFWTSDKIHPKTKTKFILVIGGFKITTVKSVTKPTATVETKEYRMLNHFYKYPGLVKWDPIVITMVDLYGEGGSFDLQGSLRSEVADARRESTNTAAFLTKMLHDSGYRNHDGKPIDLHADKYVGNDTLSSKIGTPEKAATIDVAFGSSQGGGALSSKESEAILKIQQIDSRGFVVEQWSLVNPVISKIEWGDLAYGDDSLVEYKLTVAYDFANFSSKPEPSDKSLNEKIYQSL